MRNMIRLAGCVVWLAFVADAQETSCCGTLPSRLGVATPRGKVLIPAGECMMGGIGPDEFPLHRVRLDSFWISATPVTNDQFAEFVKATGYVTTAQKVPTVEELLAEAPPGTPPPDASFLVASSLVFNGFGDDPLHFGVH